MNKYRYSPCPRLIAVVLGVALAGSFSMRVAHAQGLEESIDSELDEGVDGADAEADLVEDTGAVEDSLEGEVVDGGATTKGAKPPVKAAAKPPAKKKTQAEEDADALNAETPVEAAAQAGELNDAALDEIALDDGSDATEEPALDDKSEGKGEAVAGKGSDKLEDDLESDFDSESEEPTLDASAPIVEEELDTDLAEEGPSQPEPPQAGHASNDGSLFDEPNHDFEKRISRIAGGYKSIDNERWEELIGSKGTEVYAVQTGDTLWDISKTFFGDGFFWAKLWSQNGGIENPHQISRGKGISFIAGTEANAPSIGVLPSLVASNEGGAGIYGDASAPTFLETAKKTIPATEFEDASIIEHDELMPMPELPPEPKRVPVVKELPKSFVDRERIQDAGVYDATGLDKGTRTKALTQPAVSYVDSYILDRQPDAIGTVEEIEASEKFAFLGQDIFVRLKEKMNGGERVSIVENKGKIGQFFGTSGHVVEVQGIAMISGIVDENKNIYRASVLTSINPVRIGSSVLQGLPPTVVYSRVGPRREADVRVLGGEYDETRRVLGTNSVIYLDGGESAGLKVGDLMGVQSRRGDRVASTKYPNARKTIGLIKVVDVQRSVATAVVLHATEEITPGDRTSGEFPETLPALVREPIENQSTSKKSQD